MELALNDVVQHLSERGQYEWTIAQLRAQVSELEALVATLNAEASDDAKADTSDK